MCKCFSEPVFEGYAVHTVKNSPIDPIDPYLSLAVCLGHNGLDDLVFWVLHKSIQFRAWRKGVS